MRGTVTFTALLIVVASLAYGLGRKHGAARREVIHPPRTDSSEQLAVSKPQAVTPAASTTPVGDTAALKEKFHDRDRGDPFVRNLRQALAGYEAAILDLDDALKQIEALPLAEKKSFTTGVFSFIAGHRSPSEALVLYAKQGETVRSDALRALASEWISVRSSLNEETRSALRARVQAAGGGRFGLEVELAAAIGSSAPDSELINAWLNAFAAHPGRSEMLPVLGSRLLRESPDALFERVRGWTDWERERAVRTVLEDWANRDPQEAWAWFQAQREGLGQDLSSSVLEPWARSDPQAAKALLDSFSDPAERRTAIESIGKALALKNTAEAVAWAEGLQNPEERQTAHRSIYEAAPRGIGAAIGLENGLPTLRSIVPGSPLEGTGVRPGDQIVEVWQADGTHHDLYGAPLESAVRLIRGEPGSDLELRVLRRNERSGQFEDLRVPVRRAQLYFNESSSPKMK